jgi:hypothetical protein
VSARLYTAISIRFKTIADGLNSDDVRRKPFFAGNAASRPARIGR